MANVIWTPQPRQLEFMRRFEDEALYGGAAGGGKSDCAIAEGLRQADIPHYRGLILRKTYPQLSDLIDRSHEIYNAAYPQAKYNEQKHCWTFPSGAKIYFGSMHKKTDYQGKAYQYIDFDELTHFTFDEYSYLFSRCRPLGPGVRCYIRAQANPGGIGHGWVKERFISAAPPMQTIWEEVKVKFPDGREEIRRKSRVFVPSTVFDNKILLENNPNYLTSLASLPEAEKNALLYGNWDTYSGQVFCEWRNDSEHYDDRIGSHVINPFVVPKHWRIYQTMDWGYAKPYAILWAAVDEESRIYIIREVYGSEGTPDVGVKMEPAAVARIIKEVEATDPNLKDRKIIRIGDPAIWGSQSGESIGMLFERERIYFEKGNNARIDGKMQIHHRLAFSEDGIPMMYVFNTCKHLIRTLPALCYSERPGKSEDVDTAVEDHAYDALRYLAMRHVIAARKNIPPKLTVYNPLDINTEQYGRYDFYKIY